MLKIKLVGSNSKRGLLCGQCNKILNELLVVEYSADKLLCRHRHQCLLISWFLHGYRDVFMGSCYPSAVPLQN